MIATLAEGVSRREARRLIEQGSVFIDGRRARVMSRPVLPGAEIRVETGAPRTERTEPIDLLWEGDGLLAVNKPSGVPTEPTQQASAGTLLEQVRATLVARGERPAFLAAVHRLDVETSGLVLFATRSERAAAAGRAFQEGRVDRRYLAVVDRPPDASWGTEDEPRWRSFDAPIARRPERAGVYVADPNERPARTRAALVAAAAEGALLRVQPLTGRTHQIRVHLSEAGHPICGDARYGGRASPGFGLHALALALTLDDEALMVVAPPTSTFLAAAESAGLEARVVTAAADAWACAKLEEDAV